jgi:hypothetical protein
MRIRRCDEYRRKPRPFGKFFAARPGRRGLCRLFIKLEFILRKLRDVMVNAALPAATVVSMDSVNATLSGGLIKLGAKF